MAWPPPVLPVNRTDATPQQGTHPADHNAANLAINDLVTKVTPLIPIGNYKVARIVYFGAVTTNAGGNFAVLTGFAPAGAVAVGSQSDYPTLVLCTSLDTTQAIFNIKFIPSGANAASTTIGVSYIIYGPPT